MVLLITRKNLALKSIFSDLKIIAPGDFPGGPVVKNPPSNADGEGLIPGRGTKIPHATEQLSPLAVTTEVHPPQQNILCSEMKSPHAATKPQGSETNKCF